MARRQFVSVAAAAVYSTLGRVIPAIVGGSSTALGGPAAPTFINIWKIHVKRIISENIFRTHITNTRGCEEITLIKFSRMSTQWDNTINV